ncbi:hypothetical protein QBC45DRAFT_350347 [Copromyces sp. CBS 386.78]|nr:hypothetical protein QBC45DRAFT_350347 [Copromyces sp. CBS 386.78]
MPSAGIVYEGVLANGTPDENNKQNKYEGTLFNGLKFWVSQRVPARKSLIDSLKANGGKTVLLEKHAAILIADHVRKDAPAGSVSWKYITDSISEGQLADIDIYTIDHPTAKGARPEMSTKSTRTNYTPQDDNILLHWVLQKERSGEAIRGNKTYMDLAEKYPQHTWQSWRNRFIKQYDHQHRDTLAGLLPQGFEPPPPPPPPQPSPPSHARSKKENRKVGTPSVHTPAPSRPSSPVIPPATRVKFTKQDDQDLIRYLKQMNRQGESLQGTMIYKEFAEQHPHHSWQFWRKRWIDQLQATTNLDEDDPADPSDLVVPEPRLPEPTPRAITRPEVKATPKSADQAAAKRRLSAALNGKARQDVPTKSSPVRPVSAAMASSAHKKSSPRSTPSRVSRLEEINKRARLLQEDKKKHKSASIIQRAWRSWQERKQWPWRSSLVSFQALAQGYLTRYACAPVLAKSRSEQRGEEADMYSEDEGSVDLGQSPEEWVSSGHAQNPRQHFYTWFSLYNEGLDTDPVTWVTIGGKAVDMWELWTAVTKQHVPAHARDWQEIAEFLGFDWIAEPGVPNQLQAAFQEHLADFEECYKEADLDGFDQGTDQDSNEEEEEYDDDDEEAENEEIEEGGSEIDADEAENTTLPQDPNTTEFRSSPPIIGAFKSSEGLKRNIDYLISTPLASMTRKRLRYDVDDEVPESPSKKWQSPLPPIPEVASRPEEAADVTLINDEEEDNADEEMPVFGVGDDEEYYEAEEDREDNENAFITQPQQPLQPTVERALSLRPSPASKLQAAQKKSATRPRAESESKYIPADEEEEEEDSDSSSDAFAPPINPPRPPPERRRSPVPAPRPSTGAPVALRQLPPRDTVPPRIVSLMSPPRFRPIPPDPLVSDNNRGGSNQQCLARPSSSSHRHPHPQPPPSSAATRSSLSALVHQQRHPRPRPSYPPNPPPHAGLYKGGYKGIDIFSEDPIAIRDRYMSLGYKKRHCTRGVLATTHDPVIAGRAIHALASGDGHTLPDDVPGIWTAEDDADLKEVWKEEWEERGKKRRKRWGGKGKVHEEMGEEGNVGVREALERRLLEKHGRVRMELRRDFLRDFALV